MVTKLIMACILSATLLSCNGQNTNTINYATVEPLHINRFDKDLFRLIDTEDTTLQPELIKQYPEMLDIIGKGILNLQTIETMFDRRHIAHRGGGGRCTDATPSV